MPEWELIEQLERIQQILSGDDGGHPQGNAVKAGIWLNSLTEKLKADRADRAAAGDAARQ